MKRNIVAIWIILGIIGWSCSKSDSPQSQQFGLKQAIEENTSAINTAISNISKTEGYHLLSSGNDPNAKVLTTGNFKDSITLGLIAGIYNYQPETIILHHNMNYPFRLFKKVGSSDKMIVNLPNRLIFHPKYLHNNPSDSIQKNDFTISASDYHLYYNSWNNIDYKLTAGLAFNSVDIGKFDIAKVSSSFRDQSFSSQYTFTGGYTVSTTWQTGDTSKSTYILLKDNKALLKETTIFIGSDFHKKEKQYDLAIGNIEIKRGKGIDSIQVYLDGVLQKTAGAKITDSSDSTSSICDKRDILLTFDDGTTTRLSALIEPAIGQLRTLKSSLHDMHFAENVVDYIAVNIYFNSR